MAQRTVVHWRLVSVAWGLGAGFKSRRGGSAGGEGWVRLRFGRVEQPADIFERHGFDLMLAALPLQHQVVKDGSEEVGAKWRATFEGAQAAKDATVLESEDVKVTCVSRRYAVNAHGEAVDELTVSFLESRASLTVSREASPDEFSDLLRLAQGFQRRSSR
ncbi:MAG: hypothetical protein ACHQ9S_24720 [Candidatus Binatia bacterium]